MQKIPQVQLDTIQCDQTLVRMLQEETAHLYHALPIAADGERVTVAMAEPGDDLAVSAIQAEIGAQIFPVKADLEAIDQKLEEIWSALPDTDFEIVFWPLKTSEWEQYAYVDFLGIKLEAEVKIGDKFCWSYSSLAGLLDSSSQTSQVLHIFPGNNLTPFFQLKRSSRYLNGQAKISDSLIIPDCPGLQMQKIILVLSDCRTMRDDTLDWAILLARSGRAQVTLLPLVPPLPVYLERFLHQDIDELMAGKGAYGQNLRLFSERLASFGIKTKYKIQCCFPLPQLAADIASEEPDLVILPGELKKCFDIHLPGELMDLLVRGNKLPVLISWE